MNGHYAWRWQSNVFIFSQFEDFKETFKCSDTQTDRVHPYIATKAKDTFWYASYATLPCPNTFMY